LRVEDQLTFDFAAGRPIQKLTSNPLLHPADKPFIFVGLSEYGKRIGETHPNARIPDVIVERIRDRHEYDRWGYVSLSREFGIALTTVRKICTYERRAGRVERWKKIKVING
jgi:hypothetical protein